MPLRLKSLELHGYKTFAARTNFEFAEGITAIVGPNGSGKSNIADALRWVLGEQSYSLLRAKKTEDMIFAGSEQRPRAGMASAGVIFDNSGGWLPVDFSDVALARRSYRDGRNEYLLNSQHVRLKDINELLAQSGLSERTYTILGQGLVDASLALKADERRRLFEEAAGIGLYRTRKEETLRRLEITERNLDRALDILAELEPRLKSLERQAARAREYAQVQADLRVLLHEWYGFHWHRAQSDLKSTLDLGRTQEVKLNEERESYQHVREEFTAYRERLNGLRARLNSWHRQSAQLHEGRESTSSSLAMLEERQRALLDNRQISLNEQSRFSNEHKLAQERLSEVEEHVELLQKDWDEAKTQTKVAQTALDERLVEKSRLETEVETTRQKVEELAGRRAGLQARINELASRIEGQKQKLETMAQAIVLTGNEGGNASRDLKEEIASRQKSETTLQKAEAELQLVKNRLTELESKEKEKQEARSSKQTEQARLKAQLEVLEQAEQSLVGYADGAKLLLEASRTAKLSGARGALSAFLDIPAELEVAIAAAMGEYTDAILLESGPNADQALALLDSSQTGRTSLLPLDWLTPDEPLNIKPSADCLGVASELVKTTAEYRPALDLLLGRVLIVRDRLTARRVLAGLPKTAQVVTLSGEVFRATGQVSAGKPNRTVALGRPRQRRELQESLVQINSQITELDAEIKGIASQSAVVLEGVANHQDAVDKQRSELESVRDKERQLQVREESARRQWEWQVREKDSLDSEIAQAEQELKEVSAKLSADEKEAISASETLQIKSTNLSVVTLNEFQEDVKLWSTRAAVAEHALINAQTRHEELSQAINRLQIQEADLENHLTEIDKTLVELGNTRENLHKQVADINNQLQELRNLIEPAEKELESSEEQEQNLQKREAEDQFALARIERTYNQIQLESNRKQEALESLRQKVMDDFGLVEFEYATDVSGPVPLPLDGMVDQLPVVIELSSDLEENIVRLRAQLRRMGAINPEAQEEYQSVKERHAFLTGQLEDLRAAEADLHQVIAELDELTRNEFQKTFEAVAEQFHTIFHRLFGGGAARLVLTDPENLTETGIDIEARLPGRREQGLSLLSGGERSLTAIALVFSLLKVSPTPVCVMDEVDAMLDEANVGRFRDLLLELSKETQFIIITHNRNTVQAADVIYGVTMGRDSTSQIISLKLDEVSEEYLK